MESSELALAPSLLDTTRYVAGLRRLPAAWEEQEFWGKLHTFSELQQAYSRLGVAEMIAGWQAKNGWAGCYVEAHLWDRSLRPKYAKI